MDNKLTLKLDDQVIAKAKRYAQRKNTSLSKLVESYLELLTTASHSDEEEVTPLVKSLSGSTDLPILEDYKATYKKHIRKKYSK